MEVVVARRRTYAAIAWDEVGFEVATSHSSDVTVWRTATAADVGRYLTKVRDSTVDRLTCIVESTDGMLDNALMAAGLEVLRADPAILPPRPLLGSVGALELLRAATQPDRLTTLRPEDGSLTGRSAELGRLVAESGSELADLAGRGRCVSSGVVAARTVALTFDDGPHPPYTEDILSTLAGFGVPATFFCVGLHARTHRDLVRRMAGEGHRLGNHTYSHAVLPDLDAAQTREQLDRTDELLPQDAARPLFRPPYGVVDPAFARWFAGDATARSMVLWDVDASDWACPGPDTIAVRTLAGVRPGSIVLLHDGGGDRSQTVAALPRIVETLLERDYTFVTADAMFGDA